MTDDMDNDTTDGTTGQYDEDKTTPESGDDSPGRSGMGPAVSRRAALTTLGLTGLLGLGAGTASADPQGQIGTSSDPLTALYTRRIDTDSGSGLTVNTDDGSRVLELGIPQSDGVNTAGGNVVAGHPNNVVNNGAAGAVVGGGGNAGTGNENTVEDHYGVVGGGEANQAGSTGSDETNAEWATVGGGKSNTANGTKSTVGGGGSNTASNMHATVGGGTSNTASGSKSTVGGGESNTASGDSATVPGGAFNTASGLESFAAGLFAKAADDNAFVWNDGSGASVSVGGSSDQFSSSTTTNLSGAPSGANTLSVKATSGVRFVTSADNTSHAYVDTSGNVVSSGNLDATGGTVKNSNGALTMQSGSGSALTLNTDGGTPGLVVAPGESDVSNSGRDVKAPNVIGGHPNNNTGSASPVAATIAGGGNTAGIENEASADYATVGGGSNNTASGIQATVSGGQRNEATVDDAAIGGGFDNTASGYAATVPGGANNIADGSYSFAAGRAAEANHGGAFVWADNTNDSFKSGDAGTNGSPTGANTFHVLSNGGVRFVTNRNTSDEPNAGAYLSSGGSSWQAVSARSAKHDIEPVDPQSVLAALDDIDVHTWAYDSNPDERHMGPMAGEFHEAFELGDDPETIGHVDADGVAFAAIQGLAERLDEKDDRIDDQQDRIEKLETENDRLREQNAELESRLERIERELGIDTGERAADD